MQYQYLKMFFYLILDYFLIKLVDLVCQDLLIDKKKCKMSSKLILIFYCFSSVFGSLDVFHQNREFPVMDVVKVFKIVFKIFCKFCFSSLNWSNIGVMKLRLITSLRMMDTFWVCIEYRMVKMVKPMVQERRYS